MLKLKFLMSKMVAGILSITLVLTGAMSLSTIKKHTASADMYGFVSAVLDQILEVPGSSGKICMLVDNNLIPNAQEGTRISQVARAERENSSQDGFILTICDILGISANSNAFSDRQFFIFAQSTPNGEIGNDSYIDLVTGEEFGFFAVEDNCFIELKSRNRNGARVYFSLDDTIYCGVMMWNTNEEIILSYKDMKRQLGEDNFMVYANPTGGLTATYPSGDYDLWMQYYRPTLDEFLYIRA